MNANERLFDDAIRHQIYLQGFNNRQVRDMLALLRKVENRVLSALVDPTTGYGEARLTETLKTVRGIMSDGYGGIVDATKTTMKALGDYEAEWQVAALARSTGLDISFAKPAANQIWAAVTTKPFSGRIMSEWFSDMESGAYKRMKDTIRLGYVDGTPTAKIIRQIRGTRVMGFKDGVIGANRRGLETAVRTAVGHSAAAARMRTIEQNSEVVKGVVWRSTLDGRTSPICRPRDGKKYDLNRQPVEHSLPWLGGAGSAHPQCRSTAIPYLKSWKEMGIDLKEAPEGTRASMNGQVPADMNYNDWLRGQSTAVQKQVLGQKRAQLFRRGELSIDRFQNNYGKRYTLDQLRKRDAEAWQKAFGAPTVVKPRVIPRPKPTPRPAPRPAPSKFTPLKSVAEAQTWAEANIAETVRLSANLKINALNEVLSATQEIERRFGLRKLRYMGGYKGDVYKWRQSRRAVASFGMDKNAFLFTGKITDPKQIASLGWADGPYRNMMLDSWRNRAGLPLSAQAVDNIVLAARYDRVTPELMGKRWARRKPSKARPWFDRAEKFEADKNYDFDWNANPSVRGITIHENGHRFHAEHRAELDTILRNERIHYDGWGNLISEYSLTNAKEYIAESFSLYNMGDTSQFYRIHPAILKFYQSKDVDYNG